MFLLTAGGFSFAEEASEKVELEGDEVQFTMEQNLVVAQGNVSVRKKNVVLLCDYLEFSQDTQLAIAQGNVSLLRDGSRLEGDRLKFNFEKMEGEFLKARIMAAPFFGVGNKIAKVGKNHLAVDRGYLTTCDLDKPHFRFVSKKIDIYPGDKAVARHVRLLVGKVPLFYIPKFTQNLKDKKPVFLLTPGYDKEWGSFLLTRYRYILNDYIKGTIHLDYRERKDLAWGIDADYTTPGFGEGLIRTYYMNERNITSKYFWQERPSPTIERERFKVEWRHKWDIDSKTRAIWQYYKLSDNGLLKDYFEREYDEDADPDTYFLLTRVLPKSILSFRTDARVNRFVSAVERLPEIVYDLPSIQLGGTGLYYRNKTSYSNLVKKTASPSEIRQKTMRLNVDNEISYPLKLGFIEMRPYVGGSQTYYSRLIDPQKDNSVRGIFYTGADLNTKFYRIYELQTNRWGVDINNLRHIVTPSIAYFYRHDPTISNVEIDQFDGIDSTTRGHTINFSIENKFQTKREGKSVDLARVVIGSDFRLKEDTGKGGFNNVTADIDIKPLSWLTFYHDAVYDTISERLQSSNFDMYINNENDNWYVKLGKRYNVEVDDQITTEFGYKINPKWYVQSYQRFDIDTGILKEQQYSIKRDLHCWTMELAFNSTRGEGDEIWLVFTMKAFPELGFDFSTSFNRRKAGSQAR